MPSGNPSTRPQDLSRESVLRRFDVPARFDVLIIGAGINGAATFRDLALQGVRCAIVDREDFGAGASSSSTRIAHGGLRYLENGEVGLVAESIRERIDRFAVSLSTTPQALKTEQRRALMQVLKQAGFLEVRRSMEIIAAHLGVSRATVYNDAK